MLHYCMQLFLACGCLVFFVLLKWAYHHFKVLKVFSLVFVVATWSVWNMRKTMDGKYILFGVLF